MPPIDFTVTYKGSSHAVSLSSSLPALSLLEQIQELTDVPVELQKLLVKGKAVTASNAEGKTLEEAGIKSGVKVLVVGSTEKALEGLQKREDEDRRRELVMRERAAKGPTKLRSTGNSSSSSPSLTYRFHNIAPLPHLPSPSLALSLLTRLSTDPGILHLLQTHHFSIGLLTELAPHEHPNLLGLNENRGEVIKLRLRTDGYDGFRNYADVRRVLVHELTHCVFGPHDDDFKNLNSQMNKELAAYELSVKTGTHTFHSGDVYEPASAAEVEVHQHVLGGGGTSASSSLSGDTAEERRRRLLAAAVARAEREEEELEARCGNTS